MWQHTTINDDGSVDWVEPNGDDCWYQSKTDFITQHIFHFCGCGHPNWIIKYVCECLEMLEASHDEQINGIYGQPVMAEFMWSWFDDRGFTEHGVGLPGWLTDYGKRVLFGLQEYLKEQK